METFLFIMLVMAVHAYLGTLIGTKFYASRKRACLDCANEHDGVIDGRTGKSAKCETWHEASATVAGVFWFATIPMLLGHKTAVVTDSGMKEQAKRDMEVRQAAFDRMIAEQRLMENRAIEAAISESRPHDDRPGPSWLYEKD